MSGGQTIRTQSFEGQRTVILKEQQFELPALSKAQQVTAVVPISNGLPEGGTHLMKSSWQLSVTAGAGYATSLLRQLGLSTTISGGQAIVGGAVSGRTTTSKQHHSTPAVAVGALLQQTCVIPGGKMLPDGLEHVMGTLAPVQVFVP